MPKLRKRQRLSLDVEGQSTQAPAWPRAQQGSSRKRRRTSAAPYQHFASSVRHPEIFNHTQDDYPETTPPSISVIKSLATTSVLVCLATSPDLALRLLLLGEMLLCAFPPFFARWAILLAILLPMKIQSLLEVVLGLAMFSWISEMDWTYAWRRVGHRITYGRSDDGHGLNAEI